MPVAPSSAAVPVATVQGAGVALEAGFVYTPASRVLEVRYRVRNDGDAPLAVFDRGDRHAVATGRQKAGAIGAPLLQVQGGDASLTHAASPLPRPAPTSPPTPLAIRLSVGAQTEGRFAFAMPGADAPKRLRWCLGVARFDEGDFSAPETAGEVELWRASFAVVDRQQLLCTPWFDIAANAFSRQ